MLLKMKLVRLVCLGVLMLVTGAFTTILLKYQDVSVVGYKSDGSAIYFFHPGIQALFMFIGEMLCMLPFWIVNRNQQSDFEVRYELQSIAEHEENIHKQRLTKITQVLIFLIPAACDILSTILLNLGLFYTYASTYQILRGTVVIFTGIFTCLIFKRSLYFHHWIGLVMIFTGTGIVAISSVILEPSHHQHLLHTGDATDTVIEGAPNPIIGDILIIMAQAMSALQFIIEEKFLKRFQVPPLQAVGLEGFWGSLMCFCMIPLLSLIPLGPHNTPLEDFQGAITEILAYKQLQVSLLACTICVALYNFFGLLLSCELSGFSRSVIDSLRTVFVWSFALGVGWEKLYVLQLIGFVVMIAGSAVFNEVVKGCLPEKPQSLLRSTSDVGDGLLSGSKPLSAGVRSKPKQGFMTRSVRVGAGALSPHSLGSVGNLIGQFQLSPSQSMESLGSSSSFPFLCNLNEESESPSNQQYFLLDQSPQTRTLNRNDYLG